jgi:hypothetical protein
LVAVSSAFCGLSKPSRCRFFWKNSATEISRCRLPIDSAVSRRRAAAGGFVAGASPAGGAAASSDSGGAEAGADFDLAPRAGAGFLAVADGRTLGVFFAGLATTAASPPAAANRSICGGVFSFISGRSSGSRARF